MSYRVALASLLVAAIAGASGTTLHAQTLPINAWGEVGFGIARAGTAVGISGRAGAHILVGNWGLQGRYIYTNPVRPNLDVRGADPNEEYRETAILAERVIFEGSTSLAYIGVGLTWMDGFYFIDDGAEPINSVTLDREQGWTVEAGFMGQLAQYAGVAGAVSLSPNSPENMFLFSLSLLLGKVAR